jgi:hypothetical protein
MAAGRAATIVRHKEVTVEIWLQTDEEQEAVFALCEVIEHLPRVRIDLYQWKWVILALHGAVQGFMTLALRGTDTRHVLDKKSEKAWVEWTNSPESEAPSDFRLDHFLDLYKKVQSGRMNQWDNSVAFTPGRSHDFSMRTLNERRNEFIHFVPSGYSLEVSGLPKITQDCAELIRFLAFGSGNVRWYSEGLRRRTEEWLDWVERESQGLGEAYSRGEYPKSIVEQLDEEFGLGREML